MFRDAVDQRLLPYGSRDFVSLEKHPELLRDITGEQNISRNEKLDKS